MTLISITAGDYTATVARRGGALHSLHHRGTPLTTSPGHQWPGAWDGAVLAPWPNRIDHGRYRYGDAQYEVPVNEPERDSALHGLVWSNEWTAIAEDADAVRLGTRITPTAGYPWTIDVEVAYALGADGLTVTARARNAGDSTAPFGFSVHPYLLAPGGDLDRCELSFTASTRLATNERLIPTEEIDNTATDGDFSAPRTVRGARFDTAFGGLARDPDGPGRLTISEPTSSSTTCWWDDSFRWLQIFTPEPEGPGLPRRSIAVEPMTCPPDAFNSGVDVIELQPGADWTASLGFVVESR